MLSDLLKRLLALIGWYAFELEIRDETAVLKRGRAPKQFLVECSLAAEQIGLRHGRLYAAASGDSLRLVFSRDVPRGARQRFRNIAAMTFSSS